MLRYMTIYYINIRGIKSKIESLRQTIQEIKPDVIGIVETHFSEDENITIEGYHILRKDKQRWRMSNDSHKEQVQEFFHPDRKSSRNRGKPMHNIRRKNEIQNLDSTCTESG